MNHYLIVELKTEPVNKQVKKQFGFIQFLNDGPLTCRLKLNIVSRCSIPESKEKCKKIFDKMLEIINSEFALEDLSLRGKKNFKTMIHKKRIIPVNALLESKGLNSGVN